ncbi:MAG: TolC family protein, partial [Gemmatimonadaceae bacterium]
MYSDLGGRHGGSLWRRGAPPLLALVLAIAAGGCAAGPAFRRPSAPEVVRYSTTPMRASGAATSADGGAQRMVEHAPVAVDWWRAFGAPSLDTLIAQSLRASPTLAAAEATLRQAEQVYAAQAGVTRFPVVDGTATGQRQRFNPGTLGQEGDPREFTLLNASVSARYKLDLAGGNRRALEALAARADYRRYQLEAARLTLAANVANTAIAQARLTMQVERTEALQRIEDEQLGLSRERLRLGAASPDEVLAATLRAAQSRSAVPTQRKLFEQNAHLLAVLAGR